MKSCGSGNSSRWLTTDCGGGGSLCSNGATQQHRNGTHCTCRSGRWFCCRLRREITRMPAGDREAFLRAYLTVTTRQPYRTVYRNLMTSHRRNFDSGIHDRRQFLPWHRWYLLQMENLLRRVNSSLTLPYFDWSAHSHRPWSASVWSSGQLGGNGVCRSGQCCVASGRFRRGRWTTSQGRCLERQFSGTLPDMPAVQLLVDIPMWNFRSFETALRGTFHDGPHCAFGGTMCTASSAEAPEFFLHHAFIDSIWWRWQTRSPAHRRHFFYRSRSRLLAAGGAVAHDYHDLESMPGDVAVCYEGSGRGLVTLSNTTVVRAMARMSVMRPLDILRIPRLRYTPLSQRGRSLRLFHVRRQDRARMLQFDRMLRGRGTTKSLKSALDRTTGFPTRAVARRGRRG